MKRVIAVAAMILAGLPGVSPAAAAPRTAIVHARLYTMESAEPIKDATIVFRNGVIESVGASMSPPAGAKVIDASGHIVTPGLMSAGTQLGLVEISSLPDTVDYRLTSGELGAAFDVQYALNSNSTALPLALSDGLTRAISYPEGAAVAPFMGQGALLCLSPPSRLLDRARIAMFVRAGSDADAAVGGSRSAVWILLRNALDEARRYRPSKGAGTPRDQLLNRLDAEALQPVVAGQMPLAIVAERESDIRQLIRLRDDTGLSVILYGGAEAWRVAGELASRDIPVVLDPTLDLPSSFDELGARADNAAILHRAGVRVAFSASSFFRTHDAGSAIRFSAGIAVANGVDWIDGLRAITTVPAGMFGLGDHYGLVKPGFDADLVIWDGDPLEPTSAALHVWVRGVPASLDSRQSELARRYSPLSPHDWPPGYR